VSQQDFQIAQVLVMFVVVAAAVVAVVVVVAQRALSHPP
jgi:hypothetical protein